MKRILIITLMIIGINVSAQEYKSVKQELTSVYMEYTAYQPLGSIIKDVYIISPGDAMTLHKELASKGYKQIYKDGRNYAKDGYIVEVRSNPVKYTSRYETEERYVIYVTIYKQ